MTLTGNVGRWHGGVVGPSDRQLLDRKLAEVEAKIANLVVLIATDRDRLKALRTERQWLQQRLDALPT